MIKITLISDGDAIKEVEVQGHSGYADTGSDIVCSAVSAITQTALIGLIDTSGKKRVLYDRRDGYLRFVCPTPNTETEAIRQRAILDTMKLGLKDLLGGYKAYIKMEER